MDGYGEDCDKIREELLDGCGEVWWLFNTLSTGLLPTGWHYTWVDEGDNDVSIIYT